MKSRAAALAGLELDAEGGDAVDLALQRGARQAVLGDADAQHAAGDRQSLEHGRLVAELRELAGGGEACGAAADDGDGLVVEHRQRRGQLRRRAVVGHEALDAGDGDGVLDVAARALRLADVRADAAADAREGVRLAGDPVGLLVAALGDQRHVAVRGRVDRAGRLARAPALAVDGERRRHGVGERARDRRPFARRRSRTRWDTSPGTRRRTRRSRRTSRSRSAARCRTVTLNSPGGPVTEVTSDSAWMWMRLLVAAPVSRGARLHMAQSSVGKVLLSRDM